MFYSALFLIIVLLIATGTVYDLAFLYYRPKSEHGPMSKFKSKVRLFKLLLNCIRFISLEKIMKPFSLISNVERLLKPSETNEFSIINGIKVCCILQVISGHRWFIEFGNPQENPDYVYWVSAKL